MIINSVNINFSPDSSECLIPNLFGKGINTDFVNIHHHRIIKSDELSVLTDEECIWNFKDRIDVLKDKFVNFYPSKSEGKTIKASCFNDEAFLFIPNEETAQKAVLISKKQFINILIVGFSIIGAMIISFVIISMIRYRSSAKVGGCSESDDPVP